VSRILKIHFVRESPDEDRLVTRLNDTVRLAFLALFMGAFGAVIGTGITSMVSAHGGDETLVHACVRDLPPATGPLSSLFNTLLRNGDVRVVDADEECHAGEIALDWPKAGDGGLTGYEVVEAEKATAASSVEGLAECPSGKRVIGGGVYGPPSFFVVHSYPVESLNTWTGAMASLDGAVHPITIVVYAVCAEVSE
jgi:hypothetical protein